ncbi:MAG: S8 family peptidase [Prevotellaceae bacterium]|jgi:subtilisin family serine protease|nr:S8 family peptidase [Prevotellaceae bacterium]
MISTNLPFLLLLRRVGAPALLLALLLSPFWLSAEAVITPRTSALVERYAESLRQASPRAQAVAKSLPADGDGESTVGVMLSLADTFNVRRLEEIGVSVGVRVNGVATARATPAQLARMAQLDGIFFISADSRVRKRLDMAVPLTGGDVVQQGGGSLEQAYTGKGVVVGVVDWGFDFTHATFRDTAGNLRIARVWHQGDNSGSRSSIDSVGYGSVYATQEEILRKRCSSSSESHGTHVAGIAAGMGGPDSVKKEYKEYKGLAPEAELVLVELRDGAQSELIDGISYVFRYARRVGKPAVVNLSLGSHYGPHDGTSPFDRSLDGLTGRGRIAVGAAGNEGDSKLHASYTFSAGGGVVRTVVGVVGGKSRVVAFAPVGLHLNWTVELWDAEKHTRLQQATGNNFYSTEIGTKLSRKTFIASGKDTVSVAGWGYNVYGSARRGVVELEVTNTQTGKYAVVLALKMVENKLGTVHLWNLGNDGENGDASFGALKTSGDTWISGNSSYTVGEVGGTARSIISVGSFNTGKYEAAVKGSVSSFSSKGPTVDGRVKPDLMAPGSWIVSAVNGCDPSSSAGISNYYSFMSGTSMAAPMVTGAVALLLQQSPTLTPDSVRCMLQQNATKDEFITKLDQNTRGAGKLNILQAMEKGVVTACLPLSAPQSRWSDSRQAVEFKIIPNPNSGAFSIETEEDAANLTLSVYSLMGALLYTSPVRAGSSLDLSFLPHGLYVVQLSNGKATGTKKMLIYRN